MGKGETAKVKGEMAKVKGQLASGKEFPPLAGVARTAGGVDKP